MSPVVRHVLGGDMRQPEQVVGTAGAKPATGRLVPPVLDVAFDELSSRGSKQMVAREGRPREQQRHHILQLIAEAECAAGLVVAAARPQPAADRLIQQPAIDQRIEGIVWRAHLDSDRACHPMTARTRVASRHGRVEVSVAGDQPGGVLRDRCLLPTGTAAAGARLARNTQRICSAAHGSSAAPTTPERRVWPSATGRDTSPLRPMNDSPIAGDRRWWFARIREGDVTRELLVEGVSRQDRAGPRIDVRDHSAGAPSRGGPSTHSLYAKTLSVRDHGPCW